MRPSGGVRAETGVELRARLRTTRGLAGESGPPFPPPPPPQNPWMVGSRDGFSQLLADSRSKSNGLRFYGRRRNPRAEADLMLRVPCLLGSTVGSGGIPPPDTPPGGVLCYSPDRVFYQTSKAILAQAKIWPKWPKCSGSSESPAQSRQDGASSIGIYKVLALVPTFLHGRRDCDLDVLLDSQIGIRIGRGIFLSGIGEIQ